MTSKFALLCALSCVALATTAFGSEPAKPPRALSPVTDQDLENPNPEDWLMWRRTLDGWGYSPLQKITTRNVSKLRMVWARGMTTGLQEATPLVHDGVMFLPNPGDVIQSIDAATGNLLWEHRRPWQEDITKIFRVPSTNRNIAIYGDTVIDTSADDHVFALDVQTGKQRWQTKILDYKTQPAQQTSGPIIAKGKVISGRGCEPVAGPEACVITAHDARTGAELWRTRMIPAPGEPGGDSWGDVPFEKRTHVGAWLVPSFDPKLNLVYVGTSVSSPAPKYLLGGNDHEHLYHNSTLALDVETGKIVWYYQHVVDHWDMDHTFERMLLDTAVAPDPSEVIWRNPRLKSGEVRQVLTGIPGKTGIVYTLDRRTGEFLWARPTVEQNIVQSIDGAGRVTVNPETTFAKMGDRSVVCPVTGGRNWPAGTYSPLTRTMYFPLLNACAAVTAVTDKQTVSNGNQSDLYGINIRSQFAPGKDKLGSIQGISVESGKRTWTYEQRAGTLSLVSTAGGLLFGGDSAGYFRAFDQKTGRILWEINLGSPVTGYPISFAVNGRQFVAASTGASITGGGNVLTPDVRPSAGNTIFVFALPE